MLDVDRQDLTSFLSGSSDYGGPSDAIVGILKQMGDTMATNLEEITGAEKDAKASYEQLVKAKTAEVDALTASIEERTKRIGELGVQLVEMREELSDAEESLVEDKKFLAELEKGCSTKEKEWAEICKVRQEEILALADTIKILNDDDALEMFKKALPGASSFVQIEVSQDDLRSRALSFLQTARGSKQHDRQRLDLVMLALRGKKVGFEKVIKLIDDMVALMKKEQQDDADKKEYCETSLDQADDKKKELERAEGKLGKAMNEAKEQIAQLADDIKELGAGIVALDKDVAEATENRKEENSDFKTLFANDAAAKEILEFAKNRLNKFYNPKMYKPPAGGELVQVHAHDAPPPPPETAKAYQKKGEEGGGVIAMIDTLVKELDTEMTEAETNEKLAQEDYEEMMSDSSDKRAADSKSLADKDAAKGDLSNKLVELGDEHKATIAELMATEKYIGDLHGECDWLLKYFDVRKTARTGEIEALGKAKAVLNGADFGFLLQTKTSKFLRKA
jgi:TolA-binding protein